MKTNHKALTIYKASAGSGKTFTLSVEYIKLLIINPTSYRSTLAVTFTNKATEEMKLRILSQLYGIWKSLPDSRGYIKKIKSDLNVTEKFMSERASIALHNIVHNYSYFRIETIDSFFQSVLRNLARELDLTANLRIELNDYQIEQNAIDELIDELDENDELLKWIMEYIRENISDDKNWNVISAIKKFGENIFREFYKSNSKVLNEKLLEKGFFGQYTAKLRKLRDEAENEMKAESDKFFNTLQDNGIEIQDLSYGKSGPAGYFIKLRNGVYDESIVSARVKKVLDEGGGDKWTKKTSTAQLRELAETTLSPMLCKAEDVRAHNWNLYESAVLTLRHINQLRLLNSIETKVRALNAESNRFLLSDTHTLLHSLVQESDSPFIFEKIGTRLENIMIDEFQDTSTVQWQNFKVLLEECMSHGDDQGNLIVGDVKQSIYRWRSGDWRMLNNIEREFPYMRDIINVKTLDTNYRSQRRIINFNNAFFTRAAKLEYDDVCSNSNCSNSSAEQLRKAYSDVCQHVPSDKPDTGYVSIELLPPDDYQQMALQQTVKYVETLLQAGAKNSDIAIIVRSNSAIQLVAEHFSKVLPDVKIVSDEAFRLDSSVSVNIIIAALHSLTHPDDQLAKAYLAKSYLTKVLGYNNEYVNGIITCPENIEKALPPKFVDAQPELLGTPVYELVERLYRIFQLNNIGEEDAYVHAFYDSLANFLTNNTADIDSFVEAWNSTICSQTIQANAVDGIRLITIHKSKGLEFEHVIIPFCDWRMEKTNTIWCSPTKMPFNELPLVPVDFNAKLMRGTIYEADYMEEHLQNVVDNLNLLYVAFTRASASLVVIARRGNAAMRSYVIERTITDLALPGCTIDGNADDNKSPLKFTYGEIATKGDNKKELSQNIFTPHFENVDSEMSSFDCNTYFKQSNKSKEFVCGDDEDSEEMRQLSYIKTGKILHYLFASINTVDDIDQSLKALDMEGLIEESGITIEKLRSMLHKRFANKLVADWFSGRWKLFNECTILEYNASEDEVKEHRPDRVMKDDDKIVIVDFKFGGHNPQYADQVRRYMALARSMGYENVKGYLWFVYSNVIEPIE